MGRMWNAGSAWVPSPPSPHGSPLIPFSMFTECLGLITVLTRFWAQRKLRRNQCTVLHRQRHPHTSFQSAVGNEAVFVGVGPSLLTTQMHFNNEKYLEIAKMCPIVPPDRFWIDQQKCQTYVNKSPDLLLNTIFDWPWSSPKLPWKLPPINQHG